jgi:hypothetical protein
MYIYQEIEFLEENLIETAKIAKTKATFHSLNRGRVAVFIDGANLLYAALQLGIEINYAKLLSYLFVRRDRLLKYELMDRENEHLGDRFLGRDKKQRQEQYRKLFQSKKKHCSYFLYALICYSRFIIYI